MIHVMRREGKQRKARFAGGLGGNDHDMAHHVQALTVWLGDDAQITWDGTTATATVGNVKYHTIVK